MSIRFTKQALVTGVCLAALMGPTVLSASLPPNEEAPADSSAAVPSRPRIGIAFGGGGARGAAHVGVIRVLEELRIPVDYVAGTSMGAIVGALYSLGMTADEIERELLAVDWADLFDDRMSRRARPMRRKEDDSIALLPFEWGLKNRRLQPPRGFISGQKFPFAFPNPDLFTAGHESFDQLPIPFRAVATDVETGEKVVLDRGNLLRAIRASMAVPGIFTPVEWDGRLLVDGFLASNVPVDVVREMGADIVIAIDVGRRPEDLTPEQLETLRGIAEAAARVATKLSNIDELSRADILIQPELNRWNGSEYDQLATIVPPGEEAARAAVDELAPLGVSTAEFERWRRQVDAVPVAPPMVDLIVLDNQSRVDDRVIRRLIDLPTDEVLDAKVLRRDLEEIFELGMFESVDFDLYREDVYNVLAIRPREKPYAPLIFQAGAAYISSYHGASRFQLHLRLNWREVNRRGGEWRTDLGLGRLNGLHTEFYQPLDWNRNWYVVPGLSFSRTKDGFFETHPNRTLAQYDYKRFEGALDFGRVFGHWLDLRVGVLATHADTEFTVGLVNVPRISDEFAGPRARLTMDTLNDHRLPRRGVYVLADYSRPSGWLGTTAEYERVWGYGLAAFGRERDVMILSAQGGSDLGTDMPFYEQFFLGGLRNLSAFNTSYLRGDAFGQASVGWLHHLAGGNLPVASRLWLGLWAEAGNTWRTSQDATLDDLEYCGAISLFIETAAGPIHIGYGRSSSGRDAFHVEYGVPLATARN